MKIASHADLWSVCQPLSRVTQSDFTIERVDNRRGTRRLEVGLQHQFALRGIVDSIVRITASGYAPHPPASRRKRYASRKRPYACRLSLRHPGLALGREDALSLRMKDGIVARSVNDLPEGGDGIARIDLQSGRYRGVRLLKPAEPR